MHAVDPVAIAYRFLASPQSCADVKPGTCCRCGCVDDQVRTVQKIVSQKFTGWSELHNGDGLCPGCAWAYQQAPRTQPVAIHQDKAVILNTEQLLNELQRPLTMIALTAPLSGRKPLLPHAAWATVRVDDINLPWREDDVERLTIVAALRDAGCPATAFHEPIPPWGWLRHRIEHIELHTRQWQALEAWRSTPYLMLALKATHGRNTQ